MRMKLHFAIIFALFSGLLWASPLKFRPGVTGTAPVQENMISDGEYAHGVAISGLVPETTKEGALREATFYQAGGDGKFRDHQARSAIALMFAFDIMDSYPGYGLPVFETLAPTLDIVRNFGYGWTECMAGALGDDTQFTLALEGLEFSTPVVYDAVSNEKLSSGQQATLPIPWHEFRSLKVVDEMFPPQNSFPN